MTTIANVQKQLERSSRPYCSADQDDSENRASRNSPNLAVALNCGMGSCFVNADVTAFERLHIVQRPEFLVLGLEVEIMHDASQVFRSFQLSLDKSLVEDNLCRDVRQFTSVPGFHLLPQRVEVFLYAVHADGNIVDQRGQLRVFCEPWGKHTRDNVSQPY